MFEASGCIDHASHSRRRRRTMMMMRMRRRINAYKIYTHTHFVYKDTLSLISD
jgi:hypothetical protein